VLAVLAAACWFAARSARRALPPTAPAATSVGDSGPNPQTLTAVTKVLPYLTVVIAAFAPLAGAIYLITSTGWSAAERHVFAARAAARTAAARTAAARTAASEPETTRISAGRQALNRPKADRTGTGQPTRTTPATDSVERARPGRNGSKGRAGSA
jgi:hypothetical protein